MSTPALLELKDFRASYVDVEALHGVDLSVAPGEIVTVIGPNGAGKTTLLTAVMGLLTARGELRVGGELIARPTVEVMVARGIALVPEKRELFGEMSVEDNLLLGGFMRWRRGHRDQRERMHEIFAIFPRLGERRAQLAATLSGGERQMLAIGRALMARPRLLMLDEPSLGLAPLIVREVLRVVAGLRRDGVSVLLVEQNARAALQISDRAYVLEMGSVALAGRAQALLHDQRIVDTYLPSRPQRDVVRKETPMINTTTLQSYIAGRWLGAQAAQPLPSAIDGHVVANTHVEQVDFGEALAHARGTGVKSLLGLDFQQRAARLRALAKFLAERKEALYTLSYDTGATRKDGLIDIEGGIGTLVAYARIGSEELPSGNLLHEGPPLPLGKQGKFVGTHVLVPRRGVAVHINAFNFPVWGLLEKFAPSFLAGMPSIAKPASATSYVTEALARLMQESGLLPEGSLQLVIGGIGDLLDRLDGQDVVSFTGSAETAAKLRAHPNLLRHSVPFNAEADSLNCAILAPDVGPDDEEFELFVKEVAREMTVKAGQKCTAIRRAIVPRRHLDALATSLRARLAKTVVGDPRREDVRMGALASRSQRQDVAQRVATLLQGAELIYGERDGFAPVGERVAEGAFFPPTLLLARDPHGHAAVHEVEAFGPVSALLPYEDVDEALALAARGRGSLVGTLVTRDPALAARAIPIAGAHHGRLLVLDREAAAESTGHGSPLPPLKHGGPGRAGGGEELGGVRAVKHYLQRTALQGSPTMLAAIIGEHVRGAAVRESEVHPFRKHFDEVQVGDSLLTHRRTITEADIVAFGGVSGDYFYMHFDEVAAKESPFGKRIAHGYLVLSAAAGLFVSPAPGPVLANYGLDTLRFVKPVGIGDTIQARLTCKRKIDRQKTDATGRGQGVVAWDVEVTNQLGELVASYDILTLVAKRARARVE
jgi:oxepin-CoA hydrolase/3-oxo-5,6-dehydrosuberyl-CoA semialdehyde dehydrogenase